MARSIVAGNWKQNLDFYGASDLAGHLREETSSCDEVVVCPPFPFLYDVSERLKNTGISLGAQDCSIHNGGAYTGEVSATMLKSLGVQYCILGHSERRQHFGENAGILKVKLTNARNAGMNVILCCGESLELRKSGQYVDFVLNQLAEVMQGAESYLLQDLVIAYEPIWAIGTGETASPQQAEEMHAAIRSYLTSKYGEAYAQETSVLYGGSVKPGNAEELFACENIDGALVGGASLNAVDFMQIASVSLCTKN